MRTSSHELASLESKQIYDCSNGRTFVVTVGIVRVHAGEVEHFLIYFSNGIILTVTSKWLK
jgi:hypothetical protein